MNARKRFPHRRPGHAFDFDYGGLNFHCVVNCFGDGQPGEIFLDAGKVGTSAYVISDEAAVLFSLARQYGAPLQVIKDALPKLLNGHPAGPMGMALKLSEGKNL